MIDIGASFLKRLSNILADASGDKEFTVGNWDVSSLLIDFDRFRPRVSWVDYHSNFIELFTDKTHENPYRFLYVKDLFPRILTQGKEVIGNIQAINKY